MKKTIIIKVIIISVQAKSFIPNRLKKFISMMKVKKQLKPIKLLIKKRLDFFGQILEESKNRAHYE